MEFTIGAFERGETRRSDFDEFINVVSGRGIVSGASWDSDRFELGLSGDGMIRIFWSPNGLEVNFVSTTNIDENPPLIIRLNDKERRLPARLLEKRLFGIRQLYAVVRLTDNKRLDLLSSIDNIRDLEALLPEDEQLYIECMSPGSWYLTVWTKVETSYKSLIKMVLMVFSRGREAFIQKLESEAKLRRVEANEKEFELFTKKIDYTLGLANRLENEELKGKIEQRIIESLEDSLLQSRESPIVQEASKRFLE